MSKPIRQRAGDAAIHVGVLTALLVGWEVIGRLWGFLFLPPLSEVFAALIVTIENGTITQELFSSLRALVTGYLIAVASGLILGGLMGTIDFIRDSLDVYVDALMASPLIAFIPLFIMVFGLGTTTRIVIVVVFAFLPIVINTATGIRQADIDLVMMARSFGASRLRVFARVRLPMAQGPIRAGLRLGMARGLDGLIVGEVLIAAVGLGGLVTRYGSAFTMSYLYGVVLVILALALAATRIVGWSSARLLKVPPHER